MPSWVVAVSVIVLVMITSYFSAMLILSSFEGEPVLKRNRRKWFYRRRM